MPSPKSILVNLNRLVRNIRAGDVPTAEELPNIAADWATILHDLSDEQLTDAVSGWLRGTNPYWPSPPGQLLALVPERRVAAVDDADAAWGWALRVVQSWGYERCMDDALWTRAREENPAKVEAVFAAVQALGGWKELGLSTSEDHIAMRASFRTTYRAVLERRSIQAEADVARRIATGAAPTRIEAVRPDVTRLVERVATPVAPLPRPPAPAPRAPVPPTRPPARAPMPGQDEIEARRRQVAELARARGVVTRGEG